MLRTAKPFYKTNRPTSDRRWHSDFSGAAIASPEAVVVVQEIEAYNNGVGAKLRLRSWILISCGGTCSVRGEMHGLPLSTKYRYIAT